MDFNLLRLKLIQAILHLPEDKLPQAAHAMRQLAQGTPSTVAHTAQGVEQSAMPLRDWPHAPVHRLTENGTYMVTTGTYRKLHLFRDAERLTLLEDSLLALASQYEWHLEAWAVFSNHYHIVAYTLASPPRLSEFLVELHANTARDVNRLDGVVERQVWHNFWDKQLTYQKSYVTRLNYVHQNAVRHGLVKTANQYRWCSAAWFERTARPAQVKTNLQPEDRQRQCPRRFSPSRRRLTLGFSECGDSSPL